MAKKVSNFVYWTPRVLSIIFICFLALFSLDVISSELNIWQIIAGLFMHNIPAFVLIIVLIISWKHEVVGGVIFLLAGLFYIFLTITRATLEWYIVLSWSLIIAGPAFLIGILFLINWFKKRQK